MSSVEDRNWGEVEKSIKTDFSTRSPAFLRKQEGELARNDGQVRFPLVGESQLGISNVELWNDK